MTTSIHRFTREFTSWPDWWIGLTLREKLVPTLCVIIYLSALVALHGIRSDHLLVCLVFLVLSYGGPTAHRLRTFLLPLILTGVVYDSQRFYSDYIRGTIRVEEPYFFDKRFFGITTSQGVLTPNEWWQLHTHWTLDLVTGFFYFCFIGIFTLIAAYFYFWLSRRGTNKASAEVIRFKSPRIMWGFFWLNVFGYSTYYWYPAAPPWYVALYGLGPANMSAQPNPAGCLRFDQLLGTHLFTEMYGRSADVFGAIPSLHVAYPLLAVLYAFQLGAVQKFSVFFYLIMCFSAVYLNHHYILDILWGSAYTLIIWYAMNWLGDRRSRRLVSG